MEAYFQSCGVEGEGGGGGAPKRLKYILMNNLLNLRPLFTTFSQMYDYLYVGKTLAGRMLLGLGINAVCQIAK